MLYFLISFESYNLAYIFGYFYFSTHIFLKFKIFKILGSCILYCFSCFMYNGCHIYLNFHSFRISRHIICVWFQHYLDGQVTQLYFMSRQPTTTWSHFLVSACSILQKRKPFEHSTYNYSWVSRMEIDCLYVRMCKLYCLDIYKCFYSYNLYHTFEFNQQNNGNYEKNILE